MLNIVLRTDMAVTTDMGICPRKGCSHKITFVLDNRKAFIPAHHCTGEPYTKKEKSGG